MEHEQMLAMVKSFNEYIEERLLTRIQYLGLKKEDSYHSENTGELAAAMAKAHGEYPKAIYKNKLNPFYKSGYSDLDNSLSFIRPILAKNGLHFEQYTVLGKDDASVTLHSRITHVSGQWSETRAKLTPAKSDSQSYGSELSYKRRYQAEAILCISISDEDDDGETNMKEDRKREAAGTALNTGVNVQKQAYATLNAHQWGQLQESLKGYPDLYEGVLTAYKVSSLSDLPQTKYEHIINQVRKNIDAREKGTVPVSK